MKKILQHKKEIIISLITGVFLFYIQPFLDFIGTCFVKTFILINDKFSNSYYKAIAKNDLTAFSEWNSFTLNYFMGAFAVVLIFYISNKKRKLRRLADKNLKKISSSKERLQHIGKESNLTKEDVLKEKELLLSEITELEKNATALKEKAYKRDNNLIVLSILSAFLVIMLFTNYYTMSSVAAQNNTFKNDLIKLTPYTNDSTINKIKSDWARIENSKDFYVIKNKLDSLKKTNKIK